MMNYCLNLLDLPTELLEAVVLVPNLSLQDVCSLSQTCSTLHSVVSRLWGKLANLRWQYWGSLTTSPDCDWKNLCRQRYVCERCILKTISYLLPRGMRVLHLSDDELQGFTDCVEKTNCSSDMLHCAFDNIIMKDVRKANLGHQYYSLFGKEYVKRRYLLGQWRELLNQPEEEQVLEDGALLISQWMQPFEDISKEEFIKELDKISELVAMEILSQQTNMRDSPKPSPEEMRQLPKRLKLCPTDVLDILNSVFFDKLGFKKPPFNDYYKLENNFIDKVLVKRTGIPITLSVIYHAVAKRLGIQLLCVNSPFHFLLRVADPSLSEEDPVFIDVFDNGLRRTASECYASIFRSQLPASHVNLTGNTSPTEVYLRMVANIYENCQHFGIQPLDRIQESTTGKWGCIPLTSALSLQLELGSVVSAERDVVPVASRVLRAAIISTELSYNPYLVSKVITHLLPIFSGNKNPQRIQFSLDQHLQQTLGLANEVMVERESLHQQPFEAKTRPVGLRYRIGMIMKHLRYDYHCVISGWDPKCEMGLPWIIQMGVNHLRRGQHQPFYNVLVEDGTNRYAAEDSLTPCPPDELCYITHWEVGRYFSGFTGDKYIPNEFLTTLYPED